MKRKNKILSPIEFCNKIKKEKDTVFFDMDGVLNIYEAKIFTGEDPHYIQPDTHWALSRVPNKTGIGIFNLLQKNGYNVHIITSLPWFPSGTEEELMNLITEQTKKDKKQWLKKWTPGITDKQIHIVAPSASKSSIAKSLVPYLSNHTILIDDYNPNLLDWEKNNGVAIKWLTGTNNPETFDGLKLSSDKFRTW